MDFKRTLKFIYVVSKISGYVFISIDFDSDSIICIRKQWWNFLLFAISFGFSFSSNFLIGYLPIAKVTHSMLNEFGVNVMMKATIRIYSFLKIANAMQNQKFFKILSKLQQNNFQV